VNELVDKLLKENEELKCELDKVKEKIEEQARFLQRSNIYPRNILLIGRTGSGKSTLANVLTNTNKFKEGGYGISETKNIQVEEFEHQGIRYRIIDTIGIGDTKLDKKEVLNKIAEAAHAVEGGINQVLFVTSGRFTKEEMSTYELLRKAIFDEDIVKYTTIVKTRTPYFRNTEECQEDKKRMINENEKMKEVINSCVKIIHINNLTKDEEPELKSRDDSRAILLNHLITCKDLYSPKNLKELNNKTNNSITKKAQLEKDLVELKLQIQTMIASNLNNSRLVERFEELKSDLKKERETIHKETEKHIKEKWPEWMNASNAIAAAGVVATVIVAAACRIM